MSTIKIATQCPICCVVHEVEVDIDAYKAWQKGMLIQDAFPNMPASERELLKTGMCSSCWDLIFKED